MSKFKDLLSNKNATSSKNISHNPTKKGQWGTTAPSKIEIKEGHLTLPLYNKDTHICLPKIPFHCSILKKYF